MKALNTLIFIRNATESFNRLIRDIKDAADYETARIKASAAEGFIDGLDVLVCSMVCEENRHFTEDADELLSGMSVEIYRALLKKARDTQQDSETIRAIKQELVEMLDEVEE